MLQELENWLDGKTMTKNPDVALVYRVRDAAGRDVTDEARRIQRKALRALPDPEATGAVRVCAEGDSWINILWPWSSLFGHQKTFFDVIEASFGYDTRSVAWPGDTLSDMLADDDHVQLLQSNSYRFFIFSGGGNDVLGGGALKWLLRDRSAVGGGAGAEDCLHADRVAGTLATLSRAYGSLAATVASEAPGTHMLTHGYDYPSPLPGQPWLARPFEDRGYDLSGDGKLIDAVLRLLVDRYNQTLEAVAARHRNVTHVDLRDTVAGRWNDELHPTAEASMDIAAKFIGMMPGQPAA